MSTAESCPECGSEQFDELKPDDATSQRQPTAVVCVCRECGTAWETEAPRR